MAFGIALMVVGLLGYVGCVIISFMMNPLEDDIRIVTLLTFLSIMAFMLGSIIEIKDMRTSMDYQKFLANPEKQKNEEEKPTSKSWMDDAEPINTE